MYLGIIPQHIVWTPQTWHLGAVGLGLASSFFLQVR